MKYSLSLLAAEWKSAAWSKRWFLSSHLVANALMIVASLASVAAGAFGSPLAQMILLGGAALCGLQAMLAWSVLQRRFGLSWSLW